MIKKLIHTSIRLGLFLSAIAWMVSCADTLTVPALEPIEEGIQVGEQVLFSACVPQAESTRTAEEEYNSLLAKYQNVKELYPFNVNMLIDGSPDPTVIGSTNLVPVTTETNESVQFDSNGYLRVADDATPLYWQSNNTAYGFEATSHQPAAGATVAADQSDYSKFFAQDYIQGYGYVKAWDGENQKPVYNLDAPNFLTSKQWYAANKALGLPAGVSTNDYYKTIPLYMQHKRARISVILRAGEGVDREHLQYDDETGIYTAADKVKMEIFSYQEGGTTTAIKPLLSGKQIEYQDRGATDPTPFWTACYDAIVEPSAYADNATEHKIAAIEVSNMKFSFYAANDTKYSEYLTKQAAGNTTEAEAALDDVKSRYNLNAGEHLVLEVTLSTGDRKILITAYVVDWEDWPFISKCDDYGGNGDPITINNRLDLINFLLDEEKNKAGNIAFINPTELNLEARKPDYAGEENDTYPDNWGEITAIQNIQLKATLSLARATLKVNHTLFPGGIDKSGSLINGTLEFGHSNPTNTIECAIAPTNKGSIERIVVKNITGSKIKATRGGLVKNNTGYILRCTSNMPVHATDATTDPYIGGIAATSLYPRGDNNQADKSTVPIIDMCTVNARVSGGTQVYGGGIVGKAEGKITNNTFEYGMTIMQEPSRFKNIIAAKGDTEESLYDPSHISGNQWPTNVRNDFTTEGDGFVNARTGNLYTYVLDCEEELRKLVTESGINTSTVRVRFSNDFTVMKATWKTNNDQPLGRKEDSDRTGATPGNVLCEIDGGGYTVYLDGTDGSAEADGAPMLFTNIVNHVHDMTIVCLKNVKSIPDAGLTDAIAPLAYSVSGASGKLSGIKVKVANGKQVQASNPSGLVVRAYEGATIEDCESNAPLLKIELSGSAGSQAIYFVGGLVNTAIQAKISRCTYHGDANAFTASNNGTVYYGGIVGGAGFESDQIPEIEITDCTSWLSWTDTSDNKHPNWGGIIGYAVYGTGTTLLNAMKDCQGNWWQAAKPTGKIQEGKKEDDIIGKKNSIAPQSNPNYGNY